MPTVREVYIALEVTGTVDKNGNVIYTPTEFAKVVNMLHNAYDENLDKCSEVTKQKIQNEKYESLLAKLAPIVLAAKRTEECYARYGLKSNWTEEAIQQVQRSFREFGPDAERICLKIIDDSKEYKPNE